MITIYAIGTCIIMNANLYKIIDFNSSTYLLEEKVKIFEEPKFFKEWWKIKYVNEHSKIFPYGCNDGDN